MLIKKKKYSLNDNFFETIIKFYQICYENLFIYHNIIRLSTILLSLIIYLDFLFPPFQIITRTICNYFIWFLLGILSSIGFGTGMQTGVLFVFPAIINEYEENIIYYSEINYNIYYSYIQCLPMVLFWGIGTAFGELPPYLISRKINYNDTNSLDKMFKMLGDNSESLRNNVKNSVEKFKLNKNYSYYTIICLSAWPNAMFDICGISAGLVKLKLDEFLIPTIIGKAFIKTPIQLAFILYSYGHYGDNISSQNKNSYLYLYYIWNTIVISFTLYVFKEYIENIVN